MKKIIKNGLSITLIVLLTIFSACTSNDCEYINIENVSGVNLCAAKNVLNVSTGIDELGNVIAPGVDVVDPFWRLINRPLFNQSTISSSDQILLNSLNGNSFIVNHNNSNSSDWVNQNNSSSICAYNAGLSQTFNAVTITNNLGGYTPYIFERSFCIINEGNIIIDIEARGSILVNFELVNNLTNFVYAASQDITASSDSWYDVVNIPAGTYSIRAFLIYKDTNLPAFSVVGNISTADNSLALTNNKSNCCSNNIIALTIINDGINGDPATDNCDGVFDSNLDLVLSENVVANIINSSGTIVSTQNVDTNGNIIFAGLPDGTYTVQIIIFDSSALITPNNFQVTLSNNEVKNFNIFVCQ